MIDDAKELAQRLQDRIREANERVQRDWSDRSLSRSGMDKVLQGEAVEVSKDTRDTDDHGL